MALSGTLSDLGVVDLVQFPATANKTGELIVAGVDNEARLYYLQGKLVHVICGSETGMEAMIVLMGWTEGEFEFRQNVTCDTETVQVSTTEMVSKAIWELEERRARNAVAPSAAIDSLRIAIEQTAKKLGYVAHAALYKVTGELICSWDRGEEDPGLPQLIDEVRNLFDTHPRSGLNRIYLTDTVGTCIATVVNDAFILLLSADELASLGMISLASNKMTAALIDTLNS
jgi:hypothetical protein